MNSRNKFILSAFIFSLILPFEHMAQYLVYSFLTFGVTIKYKYQITHKERHFMRKSIVILVLFFSPFSWAEEAENNTPLPTITMLDKSDNEVEVSNCTDYIKYSLDKYRVKEEHYHMAMKVSYLECSAIDGQDIPSNEASDVLNIIHNAELSVPLPEYMQQHTPKELELILDSTKNTISGYVLASQWHDKNPNYAEISLEKKISEHLYLVWLIVDVSAGTYVDYDAYLFNTETKEYYLFYHPSIVATDFYGYLRE